ncbi:MAG: hypothetical protein NC307_00255 [Roseburia sp.]|nr:hypothetical protein [Roseburia sp.]
MIEELQSQIDRVEAICGLIENEQEYMGELTGYLPMLNQTVNYLLTGSQSPEISFHIEEQFVIQLLNDILYGIEQQDTVFLLDALRYGLKELYSYCRDSLQCGGNHE